MPKYQPQADEMDEGYGSAAPVQAPEKGAGQPESVDRENEEAGEQTAVISNKILSPHGEPLNPGDEIVLQVVKNYGDECEVKYAPHKPGEGDEGETEPETAGVESELTAMANEKA